MAFGTYASDYFGKAGIIVDAAFKITAFLQNVKSHHTVKLKDFRNLSFPPLIRAFKGPEMLLGSEVARGTQASVSTIHK